MNTGTKVTLAFLGGAVAGAAALALLNRGKLDLEYLKPVASELVNKGMELKETICAKMDAVKEEIENFAAGVAEKADAPETLADPEAPDQKA